MRRVKRHAGRLGQGDPVFSFRQDDQRDAGEIIRCRDEAPAQIEGGAYGIAGMSERIGAHLPVIERDAIGNVFEAADLSAGQPHFLFQHVFDAQHPVLFADLAAQSVFHSIPPGSHYSRKRTGMRRFASGWPRLGSLLLVVAAFFLSRRETTALFNVDVFAYAFAIGIVAGIFPGLLTVHTRTVFLVCHE